MLILRRLNAKKKFKCNKLLKQAHALATAYRSREISREEFLEKARALARKYKVKNFKQLLIKVNK